MHDFIADGDGYEGADEYVPASADPYELNKTAPKVAVVSGASALIHIDAWKATEKVFSVATSRPEQIRLRLFNYPAWRVEVNDHEVHIATQPVTGELVLPVMAGTSNVRIIFTRTRDRVLGEIISLVGLLSLSALIVFRKPRQNAGTTATRAPDLA
jgi:hypothetical protein